MFVNLFFSQFFKLFFVRYSHIKFLFFLIVNDGFQWRKFFWTKNLRHWKSSHKNLNLPFKSCFFGLIRYTKKKHKKLNMNALKKSAKLIEKHFKSNIWPPKPCLCALNLRVWACWCNRPSSTGPWSLNQRQQPGTADAHQEQAQKSLHFRFCVLFVIYPLFWSFLMEIFVLRYLFPRFLGKFFE